MRAVLLTLALGCHATNPARIEIDRQKAAPVEASGWTCPMHPAVHRDGPGACPACGMALTPIAGG